jgi:hypothetical protein
MDSQVISIPKPERRGPKPRRSIPRGKRPSRVRQRGNRGQLRELADDLQSLYIRHRAGWYCWICGQGGRPQQAAHLFAKSEYRAGRYIEDNLRDLCSGCHTYYTHRPASWCDYLQRHLGMAEYESLRARCQVRTGPHDYVGYALYYRQKLSQMAGLYKIQEKFDALVERGEKLGIWPPPTSSEMAS